MNFFFKVWNSENGINDIISWYKQMKYYQRMLTFMQKWQNNVFICWASILYELARPSNMLSKKLHHLKYLIVTSNFITQFAVQWWYSIWHISLSVCSLLLNYISNSFEYAIFHTSWKLLFICFPQTKSFDILQPKRKKKRLA